MALTIAGRQFCNSKIVSKSMRRGLIKSFAGMLALCAGTTMASAGDFSINWGTTPNWPINSTGPVNFSLTDQYGFSIDVSTNIARFGGTAVAGFPDETAQFGTSTSIGIVWDANNEAGSRGESTNTATLSFSSGGSPFGVNGLNFIISDIDSVDNFSTADRCDFVTVTGNAGNPTLSYVSPTVATRSVIIGPGTGSGSTGPIAANEAQCVFNTASGTGSPNSNADDNGSILTVWPDGTSTATIAYDDSIEEVYAFAGMNPAARGIGVWNATAFSVPQTISLVKTTTSTDYLGAGETLNYSFEVTNEGPLPFNSGQEIVINDDRIGQFTCGTIPPAGVAVGASITCSASYTTTAADATAANVTNTAVAGIGTVGQAFASRLQSNSDDAVVPRTIPNPLLTISKTASAPGFTTGNVVNAPAGTEVTYTYVVTNTGNVIVDGVSIGDVHDATGPDPVPGNEVLTSDTGTTGDSTDPSGADGTWDTLAPGDEVTFSSTYTIQQGDVDTYQ